MINFRVDDLDTMADQLLALGEEQVDVKPQRYPNGRFAQLCRFARRATASSSGSRSDPE